MDKPRLSIRLARVNHRRRRTVPVFALLALAIQPTFSCYLHYTSVRGEHADQRGFVRGAVVQPLAVDVQRIDPGEHFRAISGEGQVVALLRASRALRLNPQSNLMLRIESETRTPKALTGFWPVCLTLGIIPIIQPTEHDAVFLLYDKTTGKILRRERYEARDKLIFGWASLPGALLAPVLRSVYIREDDLTREFALERFLANLEYDLARGSPSIVALQEQSARRADTPMVRLLSFRTASGEDLSQIVSEPLAAALRGRGVQVGDSGWPLEVLVHRKGTVGASGRHQRLDMTATLTLPDGPPRSVRFHTFLDPTLLSHKLAGIVKAMLFEPGRPMPQRVERVQSEQP